MLNNEPKLLRDLLQAVNGDLHQMQHILLKYSLAKVLVGCEEHDSRCQQITMATVLLMEVPLSSCKTFLMGCRYVPSYQSDILALLSHKKHRGHGEYKRIYQILAEVAMLTNFVESRDSVEMTDEVLACFKTETGMLLLKNISQLRST
ncbi:MAG: hypothetical protein IKD25_07155 [Bacteroidaceae bacterium]|nr:hypothetical protein [Bacteroidaceae bacterium]